MRPFRQHIAWIVCGWLCCQLSVLTAAPLSLFAGLPQAADSIACTCAHGASGQCPMHHQTAPKPDCRCSNATDPGSAAIVSLLGPIAILAEARTFATRLPITLSPAHQVSRFNSFTNAPDGPPPRT